MALSAGALEANDLYWHNKTRQILVSGGSGSVNVFKQTGPATYKEVINIPTRDGARTSLWVPELRLFILAAQETDGKPAALIIYHMTE